MNVCIFSGIYNASHNSFIFTMCNLFNELGYDTFALIKQQYKDSLTDYESNNYVIKYIEQYNFKEKIDILYIINQSNIDNKIIKQLRKINKNIKVCFACHEPWNGWKNTLKNFIKKKESTKATIKLIIKYLLLRHELKRIDYVFLFSKAGKKRFDSYFKKYVKKTYLVTLPFTDENNNKKLKKEYFSFIGSIANAHNFDGYLETVKYVSQKNKNIKFMIATKDVIPESKLKQVQFLIDNKRLTIHSGHVMSNNEINQYYDMSIAIWLFYNTSVQSGVLCKAFMFGSPVIASNIGSFKEFVIDNYNGYLLDNLDLNYICSLLDKISKNQTFFYKNSILTFNNNFNYKFMIKQYKEILNINIC